MAYRCARCHSRLTPSCDPEAFKLCKCGGVIEDCADGDCEVPFFSVGLAAFRLSLRLKNMADSLRSPWEQIWFEAREKHLAQMRKSAVE